MVGHEKDAHLSKQEEANQENNTRCTWKTLEKGKKNHDLSKNQTFLLGSACIMYGKEINLQ